MAAVPPFGEGHGGTGHCAEGQLSGGQRESTTSLRSAAIAAKPSFPTDMSVGIAYQISD